ncbi:MAG TPA: hypothetical protein VN258_06585 [Mobilitalea sp.]|nr:hypothetical protein [Mobilitalea sp.]
MENKEKIILDLCGGTGSWSKPYKDAGYKVKIITLPDYDVTDYIIADLSDLGWPFKSLVFRNQKTNQFDNPIRLDTIHGILAAPPCTEFSVLNCVAAPRERNEDEGMRIVNACMKIIEECNPMFWALENPIGYLRKYLGKPKMSFQPWEFGDGWTKRTDIWGEYNIPEKKYNNWDDVPKLALYTRPNRGKPNFAYLHKSAWKDIPQLNYHKPGTDAEFRAMTPPSFAKAFFEANQ